MRLSAFAIRHAARWLVMPVLAAALAGPAAAASDIDEMKTIAEWAKSATGGECDFPSLTSGDGAAEMNRRFDFDFAYVYDLPEDPKHNFTLWELHCMSGAYNVGMIYVTKNFNDQYRILSFAQPNMAYEYVNMETMTELKGKPTVKGWGASQVLTNAAFDPKTQTISARASWRGLGDAWSAGTWRFEAGEFFLTEWSFDPIYDLNADGADTADTEGARPQDVITVLPAVTP